MPVGRPSRNPDDVVKFRVWVYLIRGEDDDLIEQLEHLEPRQRWKIMKQLMRQGIDGMPEAQETSEDDMAYKGLLGL